MLQIPIPATELYDDNRAEFVFVKSQTLTLEHSLVSISKWESKWNIPFMHTKKLTDEQTFDYIRCMTITQNVNPLVYMCLTSKNIEEVNRYINAPMTATTITEDKNAGRNRNIITSEVLYYQMIALGIPFECQKWHLNRLITLIKVCSINNQPQKKMGANELASRNRALNAARRKRFNSKG